MDPELARVDAWWRAANYLTAGQIYLRANPLLRSPLQPDDVKPRLLGHWGTSPGLTFCYAHLSRAIRQRGTSMLFVTGPGHGGPALRAASWLEGTYSETYPSVGQDLAGMTELCRWFSAPGGVPSHVSPEVPGSLHEGGELGYSLAHAYGVAFDNPDLVVACVVGDGEAETGPLAASWHANKLLDPRRDGAVLPILHLNGYKIAAPTLLSRIEEEELDALLTGYGHEPITVRADDPEQAHADMARAVDLALDRIAEAQRSAPGTRPRWPVIVLRSPKGWTGPQVVDGFPVEGTHRAHQVPLDRVREDPAHLAQLEEWLRSYRPDELFDDDGHPSPLVAGASPTGDLRMSANPSANGGALLQDLRLPDPHRHAVDVPAPGEAVAESTRRLGRYLADVVRDNPRTFRLFGPDETASNRLGDVFEVTHREWEATVLDTDDDLGPGGRVLEVLSEHLCEGWLEGYVLSGRHGLLNSYEAFAHIIDSMVNQHVKWLHTSRSLPWRRPVSSLNLLLSSHVWRQDHNGFSHQDPGFIDQLVNKSAEVVRVYLPPDANTLLWTADHCLRSRDHVNVVVAGKQPEPQWLTSEEAASHCRRGLGIWQWAGTEAPGEAPDVVLACAGDVPTLEVVAAAQILRDELPELRTRVVNVVDLMRLQPQREHPHGLPDDEYDALFPVDRPVVFAYHGYPWLIHRLTYRRRGHPHLHVRGYKERGTTTTPFDMVMLNDLDRFHLVIDVIDRVPGLRERAALLRQRMVDTRSRVREQLLEQGEDPQEVMSWRATTPVG